MKRNLIGLRLVPMGCKVTCYGWDDALVGIYQNLASSDLSSRLGLYSHFRREFIGPPLGAGEEDISVIIDTSYYCSCSCSCSCIPWLCQHL